MPIRGLTSLILALVCGAGLHAEEPSALVQQMEARLRKLEGSETDKPSIHPTGTLQAVTYWFGQSAENRETFGTIPNAATIRRAQLGVFGDWYTMDYKLVFEFATDNQPQLRDAFGRMNDLPIFGSVAVGNIMEPFGFERVSSNRYLTFIERGAIAQAFAPARNVGLLVADTAADERGTWALGVFRHVNAQPSEDTGPVFGSAITARLTVLPVWDDDGRRYVHFGAAGSLRGASGNQVQFEARPEASLRGAPFNVPYFVDTGLVSASSYQLGGLEFVATRGPCSLQAEYNIAPVQTNNFGTQFFQGGYIYASWLLTGEHRPYHRATGTMDRVVPTREFVHSGEGTGAWELAFRVTYLDLDSGPVRGGQLLDYTAALNWYLNPYLRATFNYIHADASPGGSAEIFGIRIGYDF